MSVCLDLKGSVGDDEYTFGSTIAIVLSTSLFFELLWEGFKMCTAK